MKGLCWEIVVGVPASNPRRKQHHATSPSFCRQKGLKNQTEETAEHQMETGLYRGILGLGFPNNSGCLVLNGQLRLVFTGSAWAPIPPPPQQDLSWLFGLCLRLARMPV